MKQKLTTLFNKFIEVGLVAILLLMPFHAFFAITFGSFGINRTLIQSWKEILIILMAFAWLGYSISKKRLQIRTDATNILFLLIVLMSVVITAVINPGPAPVLYGIKTNIVPIALFFIAQIPFPAKSFLKRNLLWLVVAPGVLVGLLALAQALVLPPAWLEKIGYGYTTINPRQIVDGSLGIFRSFATLGGPNQLGAYLILPLVFSIVYGIKKRMPWLVIAAVPVLGGIVVSYSRSAWIGAIVAVIIALFMVLNKKQKIILSVGSLLIVLGVSLLVFSQIGKSSRIENILLHGRLFENRIEGSDQNRINALLDSADAVKERPFGHGLGSAGPASFQSTNPFITENWYLQIAYEVGLIGLLLYICAFTGLMGDFYRNRTNPLAISLFSVTVGILVVNLFLHSWADSTLALIMFTLYGLYKGRNS